MNLDKLLTRSNILGWELRAGIESFAHHSSAALGLGKISVTWTSGISTAAINSSGSIFLTNVIDDARINRALLVKFVGFVIHELLHRKYTDFTVGLGGGYIARLHNAVEDIWIERQGINSGLLGNITSVLTELIGGMVIEALDSVDDWSDPAQYPFALAVCGRRYAPPVPLANGLKGIFAEASIRIDTCNNSQDTLAVAEWVLSQLQLPENKPENKPQDKPDDKGDEGQPGEPGEPGEGEPSEGEGEGQPGEGEGEGQGEGPGEGEDGPGEGEGQGEGPGEGDEGPQGDAGGSGEGQPGEGEPSEGEGQGNGHGDPIDRAPDAAARRCPDRSQQSRPVEPQTNPGEAQSGSPLDPSAILADGKHLKDERSSQRYSTDCNMSAKLRAEVKRLFDNSGTSEYQRGKRAGSLDTGRLQTIAAGNDKVFMRRLDTEGIDSAVVIMLDLSTSMNRNSKITYAIPACAALVETLTAAGVDVCVTAFADEISIIKPWGMTARKAIGLLPRVDVYGGTNDAMALSHAHGLLLRHSARRRVCFALTDGDGDVQAAIAQVESGARLGITTIGVGILHTVSHVYPQSVRVNTLDDLGNMIFKHIKLAA
jgi:Mg-chelatase subunit ChlD